VIPADSAAISHGSLALPWRTLLLTGLALGIFLSFGSAPEAWVFDRVAIAQGEWWRLITGHWVHSDLEHASWDIAALLILGLLFESRLKGELFAVLALGILGIDLWLWHAAPSVSYYCGLSGILNGLLALGLLRLWRETRHPLIWLTGLGAVIKIIWETVSGGALLTATAWPSLPEVHGVGFFCGLLFAASLLLLNRREVARLGLANRWSSVRQAAPYR
jgi:rhomboid family GlyGly-CTERM serine protease